MIESNPIPLLYPGDCLLYDSGTLVDRLIKFRTWSNVAHVEIYLGNGVSTASRNGVGVDFYPTRYSGLRYIRRPEGIFDLQSARKFAESKKGTPYGWADLGRFYLLKIPGRGLICSQYGDLVWRAGQIIAFAQDYPAGAVSPRDFLVTPLAKTIWRPANTPTRALCVGSQASPAAS